MTGDLLYNNDMNQVETIQNQLGSFMKKEKSIVFSYIFGSVAQGTSNLESDVDLAVYLDEKKAGDIFKKRLFLIEKIQSILKKSTEVVVLNEIKSTFFKFVIIKEGKMIFERDPGQRVDFELRAMQEYYDFRPFLEKYNEAYLQRNLNNPS
jgi:predicted nucleotidyltransferase